MVLYTEHHLDEMCLRNIDKYKGYQLVNVESNFEEICKDLEQRFPDKVRGRTSEGVPEGEVSAYCLWLKNEFGPSVSKVSVSRRKSEAPGVILGQLSSSMRQMMLMFDPQVRRRRAGRTRTTKRRTFRWRSTRIIS
jgi:TNF receptor-associated protein 1